MNRKMGIGKASLAFAVMAVLLLPAATASAGEKGQARAAAVKFCNAEKKRLGKQAFNEQFGSMRECKQAARQEARNAAQECRAERQEMGSEDFRETYGTNKNGRNAFGKCVSGKVRSELQDDDSDDEESAEEEGAAQGGGATS